MADPVATNIPPVALAAEPPAEIFNLSAREIVDRGQELLRGVKSSRVVVAMTLARPSYRREIEVESYHLGREKSFLVARKPAKEKGNRTLRIKQDIWTYSRDAEQVMKVPFSMMHSSWMGSDFTYEDMVKLDTFVTDYTQRFLSKIPDPQKRSDWLVVIELLPKEDAPVVWGKVLWSAVVSSDGREVLPVLEQDFNERGEIIREIKLDQIKVLGGRRMPTLLTCEPMKKKDSKTILEYKEAIFDLDLKAKIFTKETLERGLGDGKI